MSATNRELLELTLQADTKMSTTEALTLALERVTTNFRLLLAGKPVRDVSETLAEVEAALAQQAVPQADDVVERLMGLVHEYADAELLADRATCLEDMDTSQERSALESALRTALSQAVTQAGGLSDAEDAARYRWLRERRDVATENGYPTPPWVVRCELAPWPTNVICHGVDLDAAIDAASAGAVEGGR